MLHRTRRDLERRQVSNWTLVEIGIRFDPVRFDTKQKSYGESDTVQVRLEAEFLIEKHTRDEHLQEASGRIFYRGTNRFSPTPTGHTEWNNSETPKIK